MWRLYLRRGDLLAIVLAVVLVVGLAWATMTGRLGVVVPQSWYAQHDYGFGPGWRCTYPGRGEPVCVKDAPPPPAKTP